MPDGEVREGNIGAARGERMGWESWRGDRGGCESVVWIRRELVVGSCVKRWVSMKRYTG